MLTRVVASFFFSSSFFFCENWFHSCERAIGIVGLVPRDWINGMEVFGRKIDLGRKLR